MTAQYRSRSHAGRLGLTMLLFAVAAFSLYTALAVYSRIDWMLLPSMQVRLPSAVPLPGVDPGDEPSPRDRVNILVLGLDKRPTESSECTRADTFFVMSLDSFTGKASILSFPRDLYVDVPDGNGGTYKQRINTTTVFGCLDGYPGGGPGLAKDTLALNFGVPVNYYAIIDLEGFEQLIDSMGGIDVVVPEQVVVESQVFDPGPQHMDGARALMYSRLRPDGDFKRIERQQLVMMATAKKALGLGLLNDPVGTYQQYENTVDSDVPTARLPGLGLLARDIGLDKVGTYSLACYRPTADAACQAAVTPFTTDEGAQVLLPIWDLVRAIIRQALPALAEAPEGVG